MRQSRSQRGRQKQSVVVRSRTRNARPGVMCGHVNWRVIDEQITLRVHAATDVGNERVLCANKKERERERERETEREREKNRGLSRTRRYTRALLHRAAPLRSLSRSLAPTGISPTTFRRRGCTPRFGEDLVINHDAAISQSNVRSLAGGWRGRGTAGTVVCPMRGEKEKEKKRERGWAIS